MFKWRAVSFPILLGIFFAVIFWKDGGPFLFAALSSLMMGLLTWEVLKMLDPVGIPSFRKVTAIFVALAFLAPSLSFLPLPREVRFLNQVIYFAFLVLPFLFWFGLLWSKQKVEFIRRAFISFGAGVMIVLPFMALIASYFQAFDMHATALSFLFLVLVTKSMDTGGYIFGMLSGKFLPGGNHKIVPAISPKKSWEGTFGGILFSVGVALLLWKLGCVPAGYGILWTILAGIVLALGSFAGDLTESAVKRACNVKDSANYIPGMGGVFDVLDSFIYNGLLFLILLMVRF